MTTKAAKDHQSVPVGIIWKKKKKKKKETNGWDGSCGSCRFAANQFPAFSLDRQLMITSDRFQLRRLNATPDEISSFIEYRGQVSTGEGGRSKDFRGGNGHVTALICMTIGCKNVSFEFRALTENQLQCNSRPRGKTATVWQQTEHQTSTFN